MQPIAVQQVNIENLSALQAISKQTFAETFAADNTKENMAQYLEDVFSLERLREALCCTESAFYAAYCDNEPIGYLKINWGIAQSEQQDIAAIEIERIYVLQSFQGKGIGQILIDKAIEIAQSRNAPYIWLGVWEHNLNAIRFYEKNKFIVFGSHPFVLGDDIQTDWLMKRML